MAEVDTKRVNLLKKEIVNLQKNVRIRFCKFISVM